MYTLDTNTIIYFLKDDAHAVSTLETIFSLNDPLYISALTEAELFSFPKLTNHEMASIDLLLTTLAIIPVDSRIARTAGQLRRKHNLKLADSIIAATALFTGSSLITRNVKDFRSIPDLKLIKL